MEQITPASVTPKSVIKWSHDQIVNKSYIVNL